MPKQRHRETLFDYVCARTRLCLGETFIRSTAEDGRAEFTSDGESLVSLTPVTRGNPNLAVIVDVALNHGLITFSEGVASIEVNMCNAAGSMRQVQTITLPLSASLELPQHVSAYLARLRSDLEGKGLSFGMPMEAFPDTGLYERGLVLRGVVCVQDYSTFEALRKSNV